ncbi:MAG: IS1595 family transposase [Glaciimonas sp.]|nr:IS1595 family transposase [Glaciimonas sp.]
MKALDFKTWLEQLNALNRGQKDRLRHTLDRRESAEEVIRMIEHSLQEKPLCPYCGNTQLQRWGTSCALQRYRCRQCRHTFNALTHTPLARLRHKDQWLTYTRALIDGLSVRKAAHCCGVAKNTSFKWRHRFLQSPAQQKAQKMQGIAEADETFFLESFKGKRHLPRKARKRGGKAAKRGTSAEQIAVLVVRDRDGATADFRLTGVSAKEMEPALGPLLATDVILCTDGAAAYTVIARNLHIEHRPVNISQGVHVVRGAYHIQNVNAYDSRLKEWLARFHGVATDTLESYLGWRRMLERFGLKVLPLKTSTGCTS